MASGERGQVKEIPLLKDVGVAKREALFVQKVELCTIVYRFDNDMNGSNNDAAETRGKELKRQTLMELLDFVNTQVKDERQKQTDTRMIRICALLSSFCLGTPVKGSPRVRNVSGAFLPTKC